MKRLHILLFPFRLFEVLKQANKPFEQAYILPKAFYDGSTLEDMLSRQADLTHMNL
ncbi:hypothetical protein ADIARSV_0136 [Arcticibacter svalbardensis MN12-7]|uniref:Uncharacterized protein n=1 Tax=Arcticibacter svalbardensis MN12-7 TaxID=1150600 RepID=R9GYJ5_9SPHI|nr:hypothetical protein [Arcticibacter svalbardensis]EOR96713.1 hypothetical protein ADIARSV_0136 [Arcticibacter svalbardensis MN12-7]